MRTNNGISMRTGAAFLRNEFYNTSIYRVSFRCCSNFILFFLKVRIWKGCRDYWRRVKYFLWLRFLEFRSCTNYGAKRNNYHKNIKSSFLSHCIFPFKRLCIDWSIGQLKIFDPVPVLPVASDFETCPGMY